MGQLTPQLYTQLYGSQGSEKVWFVNHVLLKDNAAQYERLINSVKPLCEDRIFTLWDDRGEIRGESFKWQHDFSYAKNLAIEKSRVPMGDWILMAGADFELQPHTIPEIKEFVSDPLNFVAQFWVPESKGGVTRKRKLLWRNSPLIYWERLVHEEMIWSIYRATGLGISFSDSPLAHKEIPILGGKNGLIHYGFEEDGGEEGEKFQRKKAYYLVLTQLDQIMQKCRIATLLDACRYVYNNPSLDDVDWAINAMLERYLAGDLPPGLRHLVDTAKERFPGDYD